MPIAALKACEFPGCPNTSDRRWCPAHRKGRKANSYEARRGSSAANGYGGDWQKLRPIIITRDRHCQWPGCRDLIEEIDHIIPKAEGGDDHHNNVQGLCFRHHAIKTLIDKRTDHLKRGKRYVVNGPPCSGKTQYVRDHRQIVNNDDLGPAPALGNHNRMGGGDLIYDYDEVTACLLLSQAHSHPSDGPHKIAMKAREAFIEQMIENPEVNGWLIVCNRDHDWVARTANVLRGTVVNLDVDKDTCHQRLRESTRPQWRREQQRWSIEEWFAEKTT